MRRLAPFALVVAAIVCQLTPVAANALAGPPAPPLATELLSLKQMPIGWSDYPINSSAVSNIQCTSLGTLGPSSETLVKVAFAMDGIPPIVEEGLGRYASGVDPSTEFSKGIARLNACRHLSFSDEGQKASATLVPMSFPSYGNQSTAYAMTVKTDDLTFVYYVLAARKSNTVMLLTEGMIGKPSYIQFEGFAVAASEKVH